MSSVAERQTASASKLTARPLTPKLGAEIKGYDFTKPPVKAEIEQIKKWIDQYYVVFFRNGKRITEDEQVAFSEAFGPLIPPPEASFTPTNPWVMRLGNVDKDGNHLKPTDGPSLFAKSAEVWHTDGAYYDQTNYITMAQGVIVAPEGGQTWFASTIEAYDSLDPDTKKFIQDKAMFHPYPHSAKTMDSGYHGTDRKGATHPIVRTLPGGRKSLFLTGFPSAKVVGMSDEESHALQHKLLDHATGPNGTLYKHEWQPYDLLVWNNRGVLHSAQPFDRAKYPRLLVRTEVAHPPGDANW